MPGAALIYRTMSIRRQQIPGCGGDMTESQTFAMLILRHDARCASAKGCWMFQDQARRYAIMLNKRADRDSD